jgi:ParB family chromosome partitioning protein
MSRTLNLSALAAKAESGNNSSVRRIEALNMNIDDLLLEEPFKSLFPIRDEIKEAIKSHMQEHGYDESKPVDVWKRPSQDGFEYVLVDGFTRARAAKEIGKLTVTAYLHDFASVNEARDYAIHTQRDRRNLSDAEIMSILGLVDKKVAGFKGDSPLAPGGANAEKPAKTAHRTAEEIGTSARKIERARKVSADPEMAAAVKKGELTINKGYNTLRDREKRAAVASTAESQGPDRQNEGDSWDHSQRSAVAANDQTSMLERLRKVLGNKAELIFDETGESGRISLWFEDHERLNEILDLICLPRQ